MLQAASFSLCQNPNLEQQTKQDGDWPGASDQWHQQGGLLVTQTYSVMFTPEMDRVFKPGRVGVVVLVQGPLEWGLHTGDLRPLPCWPINTRNARGGRQESTKTQLRRRSKAVLQDCGARKFLWWTSLLPLFPAQHIYLRAMPLLHHLPLMGSAFGEGA